MALDDFQRALLARIVQQHQEIAKKEAEYRRVLAEGEQAGIPIAHLAAALGLPRKTVYRHLGRSMT